MNDTPGTSAASGRDVLRALLAGDGDTSRVDLDVTLSGGAPSERYELHLQVSGSGTVTERLRDELGGVDRDQERQLEGSGQRDLLRRLAETGLLDGPRVQPPFPPDTVIGKIRAGVDGRTVDEWYVLLDPDQVESSRAAGEPQPAQEALRVLLDLPTAG